MDKEKFLNAVKALRKSKKKVNFNQTVDLIVNLKGFEVKKHGFNVFVFLPNKIKDKKIAGFLEKDSKLVYSIKKSDFSRYKEKKDSKKLIKNYDFFISNAKLMPDVATVFGRILGPAGKMPSPQLGIILNEDDKIIESLINKINSSVRIIVKEPSIKIAVAKESLNDDQIADNILAAYDKIIENLPRKIDNIQNIKIKLTMGKPVLVQ